MKALGLFLLIPLAMVLYISLATGLGIYQRVPVIPFTIIGVAVVALTVVTVKQCSVWRLILSFGGWAFAVLFVWWTMVYSEFPELDSPVAVGEQAEEILEFQFKMSDGVTTTLPELMGDADGVLISFYRGYW